MHRTAFWSEWKIIEDIRYGDVSGSVKFGLSGMEICTKVSCFSGDLIVTIF